MYNTRVVPVSEFYLIESVLYLYCTCVAPVEYLKYVVYLFIPGLYLYCMCSVPVLYLFCTCVVPELHL